MATSPNYGWLEPDNTDLVKNGALAIRTLGNAIDSTMATMVPKSIVDAKGDLIAGTAADTTSRLAVGANGETLVADSSTSTGLRYQAPVQANPVINSNFSVWQRGTSLSYSASGTPYGPDRFTIYSGNTGTCSRQTTSDTTNLPFIQYSARTQRTAGQTSTNAFYFGQSFENVNSTPFVGKTVTFSYYARKGANYSGTGLTAYFKQSTGTDQNYVTGAITGETVLSAVDINSTITTTWQRFTSTFTVTTAATQIGFYFDWRPSGTAGANDWFEVTGIQLEVGSVATPYKPTGATFQGELAACQRYYWRNTTGAAYGAIGLGMATSTTGTSFLINCPVTMRITPTTLDYLNIGVSDYVGVNAIVSSANIVASESSPYVVRIDATTTTLTQFRPYGLRAYNNSTAYLGLGAEL